MTDSAAGAAVREHLAAFNAHDTARLLAGCAENIEWITGQDHIHGIDELAALFDDWLWGLDPSLTIRTLVCDEHRVAAELVEQLTVDGVLRSMPIAAFFTVTAGRITSATIYREGSADIA